MKNDKIMNNPKLIGIARLMRKNMTVAERYLWYDFLKELPQTVNRQKVIGTYILDFYCASAKLAIDIDSVHAERYKDEPAYPERDAFLKSLGITVLNFSPEAVLYNFSTVCEVIERHLGPHPSG